MSRKKTIERVQREAEVSFEEAVGLLKSLGYSEKVTGSHHVFRKPHQAAESYS